MSRAVTAHLDYESLEPYPLKEIETEDVPLSYRVEDELRLNKAKTELKVNPSLTLAGIPPEVYQYRLGNRSALEWVIDQYQVKEDKRSGIKIRSEPGRRCGVHRAVGGAGGARELGDGGDCEGAAGGV